MPKNNYHLTTLINDKIIQCSLKKFLVVSLLVGRLSAEADYLKLGNIIGLYYFHPLLKTNMHFTYLLYSSKFLKTYIGSTSNLEGRLSAHNHSSNKGYTKRYQPWGIIYFEEFKTKSDAELREKYFKSGVGRGFLKKFIPVNKN